MRPHSYTGLFTYLFACVCACVYVISVPSVLPGGLVLAVSELIQGAAEGA